MSTKAHTGQESTDPRDAYIMIGVDDETGAHHLYRTKDEQILVVEDGQLTHRFDLVKRRSNVNEYIRHVSEVRGWRFRDLYVDMADFADSRIN